jgi:hypothetical protein
MFRSTKKPLFIKASRYDPIQYVPSLNMQPNKGGLQTFNICTSRKVCSTVHLARHTGMKQLRTRSIHIDCSAVGYN